MIRTITCWLILSAFIVAASGCSAGSDRTSAPKGEPAAETAPDTSTSPDPVVLQETWTSARDIADNVDSPAVWHGEQGEHWVLATARETDVVLAYDAATGELLHRFGGSGEGEGLLERPNGIAVVDDWLFVVERHNHRVQVFELPAFRLAGTFGEEELELPYGIAAFRLDGDLQIFVTDNYELSGGQIPPDSLLGRRVRRYTVTPVPGSRPVRMQADLKRTFGDTAGAGALTVVESINADTAYGRLLVADEGELNVKLYDFEGAFTGVVMGEGLFKYEPEGIALYACGDNNGYWIMTDQSEEDNLFYVFDRHGLEHLGTFAGRETANTEGIALTQVAFGPFREGAFFPVDNDGGVNALAWEKIADALDLQVRCTQ